MKRILLLAITLGLSLPFTGSAAESNLRTQLAGRILLQTEEQGQAWYVNPVDTKRYYLRDGDEAYRLMRIFGLGISNTDLKKLPSSRFEIGDKQLVSRLKGRIVLQVQAHGEAWYINPTDGLRYYMKDGPAAYQIMRQLSLGITNTNLALIPASDEQNNYEEGFTDVAYVKYSGGLFIVDHYGDQVLPPASLTKLMTALLIIENYPDWQNEVAITQEILDYPKLWVGNDATSEIGYKLGDKVRVGDLLTALLIASSNQSARALVASTGLSHAEFLAKMNSRATELGLVKTRFADVAGLSTETVTTAKEMAIIGATVFQTPFLSSLYRRTSHDIIVTDDRGEFRQVTVLDRNYSLQQFEPDMVKTGYLIEAQRTVVLKKDGDIVVVMHAHSNTERNSIISKLLPEVPIQAALK